MKKKAMILLVVVCLFAISISMSAAADSDDNYPGDFNFSGREDPDNFKEIRLVNGFISDNISVVFNDGDFNASEKYFFYVATNQWAWESRSTQRSLYFDFYNQSYKRDDAGGLYIMKDLFRDSSGEVSDTRAVCDWNWTADGKSVHDATIIFNTNVNFTTAPSQVRGYEWIDGVLHGETVHFKSTATHELGHALGLGHVKDDNQSLMYDGPGKPPIRTINPTDRANFRQIYNGNARASASAMILQNEDIPTNNQTYDIDRRIEMCYEHINDSELIDRSDLVIKGRVKEIPPTEWTTADGRPLSQDNIQDVNILHLFHSVIVEVDEVYKGELKTDEIIIHKSGGTSDNIRITTSNPDYREDDEVILYLREKIDGSGVYVQTHDGSSQIFVIDEDLGINGKGEKINIPELIKELENYAVLNQQGE